MIVPTMNSKELVKEVLNDFTIVQRKAYYLGLSLRRMAVKSKQKHCQMLFDYKSKRYNNWIILVDSFVAMAAIRYAVWFLDDYGMNVLRVNSDLKYLTHLTPHFLDRYNERFLHQPSLSKLELLKQFILDNPIEVLISVSDADEYHNRIYGRFNDGIGLGYEEVFKDVEQEIRHFKTFISQDMIKDGQKELNSYLGENYDEFWNEVHKINYRRA